MKLVGVFRPKLHCKETWRVEARLNFIYLFIFTFILPWSPIEIKLNYKNWQKDKYLSPASPDSERSIQMLYAFLSLDVLFLCAIAAKPWGTDVTVQRHGNGYVCPQHCRRLLGGSQERGEAAHWQPAHPLFQEQPVLSQDKGKRHSSLQNMFILYLT